MQWWCTDVARIVSWRGRMEDTLEKVLSMALCYLDLCWYLGEPQKEGNYV